MADKIPNPLPPDARLLTVNIGMMIRPLGYDPARGHLLFEMLPGGDQTRAFVLSISRAGAMGLAREFADAAAATEFYEGRLPGEPVN